MYRKTVGKPFTFGATRTDLNLVMNRVMSCCPDIKNTLGILEKLQNFLNGHPTAK